MEFSLGFNTATCYERESVAYSVNKPDQGQGHHLEPTRLLSINHMVKLVMFDAENLLQ